MKTLYLVRHGETEANDKRIYQRKDTPLSKKGRGQAYLLQKRFEHIPIDILYASSFKRAQDTAEIINEKLELPIHTTELVNEWGKPSSLLDISIDGEESKEFRSELALHKADPYWKWQDEEPIGELRDRIIRFLEDMKKVPQDNILVVMHSLSLKMVLSVVLFGIESSHFADMDSFNARIANTGITVFQLEEGRKNWRLITWNDSAHLGEL
ncbi:MAG: histidine phosphatase family protein [bacterium]|nr:histidine phosphatase family protein [bacterium]